MTDTDTRLAEAHAADLAAVTLTRLTALGDDAQKVSELLEALCATASSLDLHDDEDLANYLAEAALWAHQLGSSAPRGVAAAVRDLAAALRPPLYVCAARDRGEPNSDHERGNQ